MVIEMILFVVLAVLAISAAAGMLLSPNAVHSALFLVVNLGTVAVFYLLLGAPFIAFAQVSVYAGAIMVLFLFVIMLLGAERLRPPTALVWQTPLAIVLGAVLLVEAGYILLRRGVGSPPPSLGAAAAGFGGPQSVGAALFSTYLLPFEVTSVLLLVAMVGAIVLTRDEKKKMRQ